MGIPEIQKQIYLEMIAKTFYASGERPGISRILTELSSHFAKNPLGLPLQFAQDQIFAGVKSNTDVINDVVASTALNLAVLTTASREHVETLLDLTTQLRVRLENLKARRKRVEGKIDDYLFSLQNTDGYYFSVSDNFSDLSMIDLSLTTAFVDTVSGKLTLPTISRLTKPVTQDSIGSATVSVSVPGESETVNYNEISPPKNALDGLTNTVWAIEVDLPQKAELVCELTFTISGVRDLVEISRIEYEPYGVTDSQVFISTRNLTEDFSNSKAFGSRIQTGNQRMVFTNELERVSEIRFTIRKTEPDYVITRQSETIYKYIFGAKDISISEHVYDARAEMVSIPIGFDEDIASDFLIDAVALTTGQDIPDGTSLNFFVAPDDENEDFDWKEITPLSLAENENNIIRFDGLTRFSNMVRSVPGQADFQLIPPDTTNADPYKRNPTQSILESLDAYRIMTLPNDVIPQTIVLEEGVNSTKIIHRTLTEGAYKKLDNWAGYIAGDLSGTVAYGRIDSGNGFFYGGSIGEVGRSVYIETYLDSATEQPIIFRDCLKQDPNSKLWNLKVFHNGREVADMPTGVDKLTIPWKFSRGLNHICVLIDIPDATSAYPNPHLGVLSLMGEDNLFEFGTVKLATWNYVDLDILRRKELLPNRLSPNFSIYNDEIISQTRPTDNFRFQYSKKTGASPEKIRIKIDLKREVANQYVTPSVDIYRIRFLNGTN